MTMVLASLFDQRLVRLAPVDMVIVAFYFVLVLAIGFYLKERANTGDDFFHGRPRDDGLGCGPQFPFRESWSPGINGLGCGRVSVRNSRDSLVLDRRDSRRCSFSALVMMPFYYISKTHSVPGYLKLRFGESSRAPCGRFVRVHDGAHERHQYVLDGAGDEGCPGLGHSFQHLGLFSDGWRLCRSRRPALSNFQRSPSVHSDLGWARS